MVDYEALCSHLEAVDGLFGLVSQQASPTGGILHERFGGRLACLFSPEHGWFGLAAAGEKTGHETHPFWNIPVHSLYGETRRPTPEMLDGLSRLVVDLQDIGVRCYTYLATLKLVMEAAADVHIPVTVLDRPIPLGGTVDGPRLMEGFSSFVAPIDVPLCHGMTPGECATFIARAAGPIQTVRRGRTSCRRRPRSAAGTARRSILQQFFRRRSLRLIATVSARWRSA